MIEIKNVPICSALLLLLLVLFSNGGVIGALGSAQQGGNPPLVPPAGTASAANSSANQKPLVPLQTAPEFLLQNVLQGDVNSKDLKGKVVVLEFWATWAVPSRAVVPHKQPLIL